MKFKVNSMADYQKFAKKTATYPTKYNYIYPIFGLVGETNEFKRAFGTKNQVAEVSDTMWYVSDISYNLDIDINGIFEMAVELEDQLLYSRPEDAFDQMFDSAGKICELIKKYLRDQDTTNPPNDDTIIGIEFELASYFNAILYFCRLMGMLWQEVAIINLEKLYDRKDRGKIKGSGDSR